MAEEKQGKGVYDAPVHGNSDESAAEARARIDATGSPDVPMPSMRHEIVGTSIVVENDSGVGAAEDTTLTRIDDTAHSGQTGGKSA